MAVESEEIDDSSSELDVAGDPGGQGKAAAALFSADESQSR
jgi:hypothetical protein